MKRMSDALTGLAAAAALAAGLAGAAQAAPPRGPDPAWMFSRLDADGDGAVTAQELRAAAMNRFARMDADSDGAVSRDEYRAALDALRGGPGPRGERGERRGERDGAGDGARDGARGPGGDRGAWMMSRADENGDGALTREEFDAAMERMHDGGRRPHRGPGPMFERLDADGDGRLTAEELDAAGPRHGGWGARAMARFDRADDDGNGEVSREEFAGSRFLDRLLGMVERFDRDGDGAVTLSEARRTMAEHGGPRHGRDRDAEGGDASDR